MPKRWRVAAEITLTDTGQVVDEASFEEEYDDEKKAKDKFDKVKKKAKDELESDD